MTRARGASRPRFRLLPTVLLTLAILGVPTVVYAWGRSSSSFDIVHVRVAGTHLVPDKRALRLLRRDYSGRNLFTVTGGDVRKTLAPLRLVADATVDRDFPDTLSRDGHRVRAGGLRPGRRALVRGRRERLRDLHRRRGGRPADGGEEAGRRRVRLAVGLRLAPTAAATPAPATTTATRATTDAAGATDAAAAGADGSEAERLVAGPADAVLPLPRIAVSGRVREGVVVDDTATAEMLRVITALPGSLRRKLAVVQDDDGQLTLRFAGGPVAVWGDAERTLAKTVALRTVLAEYADAGKTCTLLDVSIPDRTLAKPVLQ